MIHFRRLFSIAMREILCNMMNDYYYYPKSTCSYKAPSLVLVSLFVAGFGLIVGSCCAAPHGRQKGHLVFFPYTGVLGSAKGEPLAFFPFGTVGSSHDACLIAFSRLRGCTGRKLGRWFGRFVAAGWVLLLVLVVVRAAVADVVCFWQCRHSVCVVKLAVDSSWVECVRRLRPGWRNEDEAFVSVNFSHSSSSLVAGFAPK